MNNFAQIKNKVMTRLGTPLTKAQFAEQSERAGKAAKIAEMTEEKVSNQILADQRKIVNATAKLSETVTGSKEREEDITNATIAMAVNLGDIEDIIVVAEAVHVLKQAQEKQLQELREEQEEQLAELEQEVADAEQAFKAADVEWEAAKARDNKHTASVRLQAVKVLAYEQELEDKHRSDAHASAVRKLKHDLHLQDVEKQVRFEEREEALEKAAPLVKEYQVALDKNAEELPALIEKEVDKATASTKGNIAAEVALATARREADKKNTNLRLDIITDKVDDLMEANRALEKKLAAAVTQANELATQAVTKTTKEVN